MQTIGIINKNIYLKVTKDIITEIVIINNSQIQHIKKRHPNDYERFSLFLKDIVENPDYIIESSKPNTALLLKRISSKQTLFKGVLRLAVRDDPPSYKNSIITFMKIDEREWNRLLRNKNILYRRE